MKGLTSSNHSVMFLRVACVLKTLLCPLWTVCTVDTKMSDEPNVSEQKRLMSSEKGRQRRCRRNLWWQAVTYRRASNRKWSAVSSGAVNQRLDEAVAAGRAKSSATLEGRQRKWTGQGTMVESRGGPCTPGWQHMT